jgi:carotenoid cleavage dioxygenase
MTLPDLNSGALAPVADEVEVFDLSVTGNIPAELTGTLIRNGPNPFSGRFAGEDVLSWWPEAAILHAISFVDGAARIYRNRWLRSANWANLP